VEVWLVGTHSKREVTTVVSSSTSKTSWITRVARKLSVIANLVCVVLFALVFLSFCLKIVARSMNYNVQWADDFSIILFLWILFLANGLVVRNEQQITFDLIYKHLHGRIKRWVLGLRTSLVVGIFIAATPGSIDYILFCGAREPLPWSGA